MERNCDGRNTMLTNGNENRNTASPAEERQREAAIRLKDLILLGLPATNVYLVHASTDVGFVPAADLPWLSKRGKEQFAPLLDAVVEGVGPGAYGTELKLGGVDSRVLADYDQCLANEASGRMTGMFLPNLTGTLFDITSDGERKLYAAEAVRSAREALDLLWEVHTVPDRIPTTKGNDMSRLTLYSRTKLPICPTPALRLLQPVGAEDFAEMTARLSAAPSESVYAKINYDGDELTVAEWNGGRLEKTSGPLKATLSAYGDAIIRRSRTAIQLKERQFSAALDALCSRTPVESPTDLLEPEPAGAGDAVQAVRDYLCFEQDTTQIWPWFLSADEMLGDENRLREIGAALHYDPEDGYDTEEINQALTEVFGVNPALEQNRGQTMAP